MTFLKPSIAAFLALTLPAMAVAQVPPPSAPPAGPPPEMEMRVIEFAAIDTDSDGILRREELVARAMSRIGGADTNADGTLQRTEIIAVLPAPPAALTRIFSQDPAEARADAMLRRLGVEGDSVEITVLADRNVNELLARVDRNFDGAISQDEARAAERRRGGPQHGRGRGDDHRQGGHGRSDGPRP